LNPFTSALSIDEVLLLEEAGFEPVDLVMGSAYFHLGWSYAPWSQNQELGEISALTSRARHAAMKGLYQQLAACDGDGVLGTRLDVHREGHHAEFTAIGTAVRRRGGDRAAWRDARGWPFTSHLNGQDFWSLVRAGLRPVSLAFGVCVYHVAHQGLGAWLAQLGTNQEHAAFTQGLYDARELAMARMQWEAQQAGATGIVGIDVHETHHGWDSHVCEYLAIGTAVAEAKGKGESLAPARVVLSVDDAR
jgi:uncharacterized protein YbjQ (UPF0145 family)